MATRLSDEQRSRIKELCSQGWKQRSVAAEVGCSQATVGYTLNPDAERERHRQDRLAHPEACRLAAARWLAKPENAEKQRVRAIARRAENLDLERARDREITRRRVTAHPMYPTWSGMKYRCFNASCKRYADYGGRGIAVCGLWADDFTAFESYIYTMAPCRHGFTGNPATGGTCAERCSIDRIDNDGNYEPGNIRWADPSTQRTNRRGSNE
jgi:hypothetical protein